MTEQKEYIITEDDIGKIEALSKSGYDRTNQIINILHCRPYNEQKVRQKAQEEIMDEFGILYGEAAERFNEYMNDPDPIKTPEGKALVRKAWELAQKTSGRVIQCDPTNPFGTPTHPCAMVCKECTASQCCITWDCPKRNEIADSARQDERKKTLKEFRAYLVDTWDIAPLLEYVDNLIRQHGAEKETATPSSPMIAKRTDCVCIAVCHHVLSTNQCLFNCKSYSTNETILTEFENLPVWQGVVSKDNIDSKIEELRQGNRMI